MRFSHRFKRSIQNQLAVEKWGKLNGQTGKNEQNFAIFRHFYLLFAKKFTAS